MTEFLMNTFFLMLFYVYLVYKVVAPRRWRGRTKMTAVHGRGRNDRPVILLNKKGQPVSKNRKLLRELSNFLGTVVKDNVSLAYVNWRLVPGQLKKTMWDYTRVNTITKTLVSINFMFMH